MNSDQYELELDDARLRIPWGGRSPRSLTECGKLFILVELPTGGVIRNAPDQYTLFLQSGGLRGPTKTVFAHPQQR